MGLPGNPLPPPKKALYFITPRMEGYVIRLRIDSINGGCKVHVTPFIGVSSSHRETNPRIRAKIMLRILGAGGD